MRADEHQMETKRQKLDLQRRAEHKQLAAQRFQSAVEAQRQTFLRNRGPLFGAKAQIYALL